MKRKLFAAFFAAIMTLTLCACGSNSSSPSNETPSMPAATPNDNGDLIGGDTIDPLTGLPQLEDASNPNAQDPIGPGSTDNTAQDSPQSTDPASGELSGLVILTIDCDNSQMGRWTYDCNISCLDAEAGTLTPISHFLLGDIDNEKTYLLPNGVKNLSANDDAARKNWFSPDYQLLAVTRISASDGARRIGWIENEEFFDVSEKLGLVSENDFETPPRYMAAGFTEDGMYTFYKLSPDALERTYYYVPLDNLSPEYIQEGMTIPEQQTISVGRHIRATDRISDSLYIVNTEDQISRIYNAKTGELTDYVPGDNRFSWNGVVSPDGTEITFMSRTKTGLEAELFIMPLSGDGTPTKVSTPPGYVFMIQEECDNGRSMAYDVRSMLIDWR